MSKRKTRKYTVKRAKKRQRYNKKIKYSKKKKNTRKKGGSLFGKVVW